MKKCPYCKRMISDNWINHLVECDGTDKSSIKVRRSVLVNERVQIEGDIAKQKERLLQVLKQIQDIDDRLPGQQEIKFTLI